MSKSSARGAKTRQSSRRVKKQNQPRYQKTAVDLATIKYDKKLQEIKQDPPCHDDEYYMDCFILLVEGTLFRVPKHRFLESEVFRDMLSLPQGESSVSEGSSDATPVRLDGISKHDFKTFLRILYPGINALGVVNRRVSKEDWLVTFRLADQWAFHDIYKVAVKKLEETRMQAIEKILMGRKYRIAAWLVRGYADRVGECETIEPEEVNKLGYTTALRLFRVREKKRSLSCWRMEEELLHIIKAEFADELQEMEGVDLQVAELTHRGT